MKNLLIIALVLILVSGFYFGSQKFSLKSVPESEADLILFWGDGCPHCEVVKEYFKNNQIDSKLKISYQEVWYNKKNLQKLQETVKNCPEIKPDQGIGVPLAWIVADKKCLSGDAPILDYVKQKIATSSGQ